MEGNQVAIIIVTFNGMRWIENCLNSVLRSNIYVELIVVDNASTDGTQEFIKDNFKTVILIENLENIGFGMANNLGINYALEQKVDFVFLLNQDATVEPDTIKSLIVISKNNKDYGILSPVHLDGFGNSLDKSFEYYLKNHGDDRYLYDLVTDKLPRDIYNFSVINAAAWLLPVNTLDTVGGFSPLFFMYGEDLNYCQRVEYHQLKIGVVPGVFIRHDSGNNYHPEFSPGTKKYYEKFLIRTKITYANINSTNNSLKELKNQLLIQIGKSFLKFDYKSFRILLRKFNMIRTLEFTPYLKKERLKSPTYLDMDNTSF